LRAESARQCEESSISRLNQLFKNFQKNLKNMRGKQKFPLLKSGKL